MFNNAAIKTLGSKRITVGNLFIKYSGILTKNSIMHADILPIALKFPHTFKWSAKPSPNT